MFKQFMQTNNKKIQKIKTNEKEHEIKIIFRNKENKY